MEKVPKNGIQIYHTATASVAIFVESAYENVHIHGTNLDNRWTDMMENEVVNRTVPSLTCNGDQSVTAKAVNVMILASSVCVDFCKTGRGL